MRYSGRAFQQETHMLDRPLQPERLAASLFLSQPEEAYEIALEFLNHAVSVQDRNGVVTWTSVLSLIEKMHSDCEDDPGTVRAAGPVSMM